MADLTVELCHETDFSSSIWPNLSLDDWQVQGQPSADKLLRMRTRDLMADLPAPQDHADLIARGETFIRGKMT